MKLRTALTTMFADWRDDVPSSWRTPLKHVEPDGDGVPSGPSIGPTIRLFPRPEGDPHPSAPAGACVLRALNRVKFKDVRVVIMGQDPYPRIRQATGRAFEPGDWTAWDNEIPRSFIRIMQRLAEFRTGKTSYCTSDAAWNKVVDDIRDGDLDLASPHDLYNEWEDQGVLFLNLVFTYTLPVHVFPCHGVFWRPIVREIATKLATRTTGKIVFSLWGGKCEDFFHDEDIQEAAEDAGTWNSRVKKVTHSHPAAHSGSSGKPAFLAGTNPFKKINTALDALGADTIDW